LLEVPLGTAQPYGVQSGPDGSRVYVADFTNGMLLVVDAVAGVILKQIPVGNQPVAFGEFLRVGTVPTALAPGGVVPAEVLYRSSTPVSLRAVLTRSGGDPVAGATIEFLLDGTVVGSALTGVDGAAAVNATPAALSAGSHTAAARFAGGTVNGVPLGPSSASLGTLRVLYGFTGFLPPLKAGMNERGAGALLLVKWRLSDAAGAPVTDTGAVSGVATAVMTCGAAPSGWTEVLAALSVDPEDGTFSYRWKTEKSLAGKCARLRVTLRDGTSHSVDFSLR
jgi:YVTN family beta-propeller protein